MHLAYNAQWSHITPALLAVLFALIFLWSSRSLLKMLAGALWLLLIPNTIYILTDMEHLYHEWSPGSILEHIGLLLQYGILEAIGILSFLVAMLPLEQLIRPLSRRNRLLSIIMFNIIIAFAMVLGKVLRINSYVVFTNPEAFTHSVAQVATSPSLWGLTALFGTVCSGVYLLCRKPFLRFVQRFFRRL